MSNGGENPISENPAVCPAAGENGPLATCPATGVDAEGRAAAVKGRTDGRNRTPVGRGRFQPHDRPEAGVPRQTVDRSMRKLRRRRAEAAAQKAAEAFPAAVARLEAVYRQSMKWHGPTHKEAGDGERAGR
jgi:hypothetical protein